MKKSRKGLLLLLELLLLLLRLLVSGEAVAEAKEAVAEAGHWPSLRLRSEGEKSMFIYFRHIRTHIDKK